MENDIILERILGFTIKILVLLYQISVIVDWEVNFRFSSQRNRKCIKKEKTVNTDILFVNFHFPIFSLICLAFSSINHLTSNNNQIPEENEFLWHRDKK